MKTKQRFEFEDDNIKSYIVDHIGIIKIKSNIFEIVSELKESSDLFTILDYAEKDNNIKVLLLLNEPQSFSVSEYNKYLSRVLKQNIEHKTYVELTNVDKRMVRARQINILNRIILRMLECKKIIVSGLRGQIVTPVFGATLATDLRFACEDMVYSVSHRRYGLHPSGALPYFLLKYVGQNKTSDILFNIEEIEAKEAHNLGLINKVFPIKNFELSCINELKHLYHLDYNVVKSTKRLFYFYKEDLEKYFALESEMYTR